MPAIPTPSKRPFLVIPGIGFPIPLHRHCPLTSITYTIPHPLFPITITYHIPPSLHEIVTSPFPSLSLRSQHMPQPTHPVVPTPTKPNPFGNCTTVCTPTAAISATTLAIPRGKSSIKTSRNTTSSKASDRCPPELQSHTTKLPAIVSAIPQAQPSPSSTSAALEQTSTSVPTPAGPPSPFPDVQRADYHVCLGSDETPHRAKWFAARRRLTQSTSEPQDLWDMLDHGEQTAVVHHIPFISPPHAQPELQRLHNNDPLSPFMKAFLIQLRDTAMIVPRNMPVNPPHL